MVTDSKATPMPGHEIEELKALGAAHFWPHARATGDMSDETGIKLITKAEGVWVYGADGKKYFDMISGMWLKNIGHGRTEIADAVYEQMKEVSYAPGGTVSPATVKLSAKLASISPDKDSRVYLVSGGSEAVESAVKMAKKYQHVVGQPHRYKVISRRGSYHGATHAAMAIGGNVVNRLVDYGPPMPGNIHIANHDSYRNYPCSASGECNLECAKELERTILHENPETVAAFIGEPISIAMGIHNPHPDYWPMIRAICDKYGVVMIADEVITGFGRTGKMFATENWNVKPDIFTVAKALTSGYLPIGAAVASKKISDAMVGEGEQAFRHLITFGGNPASCAAGLANLKIMEDENVVENAATMGSYMYEQLQTMYEHPTVGHVRGGLGMLGAVEMVKNRDTKEPFPASAGVDAKVGEAMMRRGLVGRGFNGIIFFAPPLTTTKDEIDWLVKQTDEVLTEVEAQL
ncbi:MAG: aspartate aminotransferase family protein [Chloroflexi bacterium]|nr:aspartate aminotransferase family protein [Chloroflexota bacterium]